MSTFTYTTTENFLKHGDHTCTPGM